MKKIITELHLKVVNIIFSILLVSTGFIIDVKFKEILELFNIKVSENNINILTTGLIFGLALISLVTLLGFKNISNLFKKSKHKFFKTLLIAIGFFFLSMVVVLGTGSIVKNVLHFATQDNPAFKNPKRTLIILPFHMIFEEAFTFVLLFVISNKVYLSNKNYGKSFWIGSILSSIIFALAHLFAYGGDNIIQSIIQVLLLQGLVRIVYNLAAYKTNLVWIPFLIHWLYDSAFIYINILLKK